MTFRFLGMGFFRATLLECAARGTQTCLVTLTYCRASFCFPTWAMLFRSQFARFHIALHRPTRLIFFGQRSCVRVLVWSTVLCFRPCFQLGTPVSSLSSGVRTYDTQPFVFLPPTVQRSSYRSAHIVPFQFVLLHFHCCFVWDPF